MGQLVTSYATEMVIPLLTTSDRCGTLASLPLTCAQNQGTFEEASNKRGTTMSLTEPVRGRNLPVRLCDLKPSVLHKAAREAAKKETTIGAVDDLLSAACHPSNEVYYVTPDALPILERIAA